MPRPRSAHLGWLLTPLLTACAAQKPPPAAPAPKQAALCSMETKPAPDKSPLRAWNFTPQEWFNFLLMGYHSTGDVARPVRDCTGAIVKLEADGCADEPLPASVGPPPLTSRDLVFAPIGDTRRLVWAITDRLPDGQAQGPVAITEI